MQIITRGEWGATPVSAYRYNLRPINERGVIVHHTAQRIRDDWREYEGRPGAKWFATRYKTNRKVQAAINRWKRGDANAQRAEELAMRQMQSHHMRGNGWTDIGYHFVIFPSGRVYEGRPIMYYGAHARGANEKVGISFAGNYERATLTVPQLEAYNALLQRLRATTAIGHYRVNATACPGKNIKSKLGV